MEKASRESVVTTDVDHLIAALKAAKNKAVMDIVSATKFQVAVVSATKFQVAEFNMNGPIAFANRLLRFSIFSLTVQSDHPNARHHSATLFHDGGTVLDYVNSLGFESNEANHWKYFHTIYEIAQFYEIEFDGRILSTVESGKKSLRDICLAAGAICQHFENRKKFLL